MYSMACLFEILIRKTFYTRLTIIVKIDI